MSEQTVSIPRRIFSVVIGDMNFDVYDIEGKEHQGWNGEPKTWWLYHSVPLPEGLVPPHDSEHFVPWHTSIERLVWDIRFIQRTTTKEKWGETQFRNSTWCQMRCNGKLIYEFSTIGGSKGMSFAMAKAQYLKTVMCEHPFNFLDPHSENGRKICYYGLPATIKVRKEEPWLITIWPDYDAGLDKPACCKELKRRTSIYSKEDEDEKVMKEEDWNESIEDGCINWGDAISDGNITWFRK